MPIGHTTARSLSRAAAAATATLWLVAAPIPVGPRAAEAAPPDTLIALDRLLGLPRFIAPRLSPDGRSMSFVAPSEGSLNLWVGPADQPAAAKPVTHEPGRGLQVFDVSGNVTYRWTPDGKRLLFFKDHDGDEHWQLYSLDLASGEERALTSIPETQVRLLAVDQNRPDEGLVGINQRDPGHHDLYRLNFATGETTRVELNQHFAAFIADRSARPRVAIEVGKDGGLHLLRSMGAAVWTPWLEVPPGENPGRALGFDREGRTLYATSTLGRNTLAVVERDLASGRTRELAADPRVDVGDVLVHPRTGRPQAYSENWTRKRWHAIDRAVSADIEYLAAAQDGDFTIESRSADDRRWIVSYTFDDRPTTFHLYERKPRRLTRLASSTPDLEQLPLAKLHPVVARSRDGLELVSYVCLPRGSDPDGDGRPLTPLPMVMLVHGGPGDERAEWGFAPVIQWLANRGYAVMNVNYRGSPGFGKAFQDAERLEWGGRMQDDLVDQARWAADQRIADPARIGIFGGSYGGYATLCAMTMTPGVFACGVDMVGPANLETFMATIPPHWSLDHFARRVGDPRTEEGRAHLRARSPIHFAHQARGALLIAQGANDTRVPQAESDRMVDTLEAHGVPVTYLLYSDEGHGIQRPENSRAFYAVTEAFLARHLGGRADSIGAALEGSSVRFPIGADRIPGLPAAMAARSPERSPGTGPATGTETGAGESPGVAMFERLTGRYELMGTEFTVVRLGNQIFLDQPGKGRGILARVSDLSFVEPASGVRVDFIEDAPGHVTKLLFRTPSGPTFEAKRVR